VSAQQVKPLTGNDPFARTEPEMIKDFDSSIKRPLIVFLGIMEDQSIPFEYKGIKGRPWFALDVTPKEPYAAAAQAFIQEQLGKGNSFPESARNHTLDAVPGKRP
jgi:NAD+ diphosphatase